LPKLLSIIHNPVFGGGNNQVVRLAEPLKRRGWQTFAAVPDLPEARPTLERMRGAGVPTGTVPLHRLRRLGEWRWNAELLAGFRREVGVLRGLIRRLDADLVQVFGDTNPHLALAGHLEGRAVVWQLYDLTSPPLGRHLTMPVVRSLADVVMTTGHRLRDHYPGAESLGARCVAVYPPVDQTEFAPAPARRAAARKELGVPDDALLVGTVGNRIRVKRHDLLVAAVGRARDAGRDLWCRILGAPVSGHEEATALVDDSVARLGLTDRVGFADPGTRVADLLPAFDIYVVSSDAEGVPTTVLEAMSCAIPVVATDVGAVSEAVDADVGRLVPPGDAAVLASALLELADSAELRAELGDRGRRRVLERFDTERAADLYVESYELALRHRASRMSDRRG
jgi:glycosyltransferase involved in cell wall biosynthesis